MKKVSDLSGHPQRSQFLTDGDEMIIVNPDVIVFVGIAVDDLGEFAVHLSINPPVSRVEVAARLQVMK